MQGKVFIVTGAGSGIGYATAELLVERGAHVVLAARNADRLQQAADKLGASHTLAIPCDVSLRQDVMNLIDSTLEKYGKVDAVISNAGIMPVSPLDDLQIDDWDAAIDTNIKSLTNAIAAALPVFRKQGAGHFVTVASTAGLKIVPTQTVYAGTKHAVRAIMDGLRQEVAPTIRATTITPGVTRTEAIQKSKDVPQAMLDIAMEPKAVARCILFALEQPPEINIGEIVVRSSAHK